MTITPLLALALSVIASSARAEVVFADDFDADNSGSPRLDFGDFNKWRVTRGTVDLVGRGFWDISPATASNGLYVDLDGSTYAGGTLETRSPIVLTAGWYRLSMAVWNNIWGAGGSDFNEARIEIPGLLDARLRRSGESEIEVEEFLFYVSDFASTALRISSASDDCGGIVIDNVVLESLDY